MNGALIAGFIAILVIAIAIVVLVALPGLQSEGKLRASSENQRFRLPSSWTGYDEYEIRGFFGGDDETSHLATREQQAVTVMQEHSYVLRPQPRRHAVPPARTMRPRTRHWKVPQSGEGLQTSAAIFFARGRS